MSGSGKNKARATTNSILFPLAELPDSNDGIHVDSWGADPSLVTHHGVICRGPQCVERTGFIRGIRYKCSTCADVDFDDVCMRDPANDHPRDHVFWPCAGQSMFVDPLSMSPQALDEMQEHAGNIPEEYVVVPQQSQSSVAHRPDTLDLTELKAQLFGVNNEMPDDQLLAYWKNGIPAARLIALFPGDSEDPIECLFTSTTLDDQRDQYDAICCAWVPAEASNEAIGTNEASYTVYTGEECRAVTRSTAEALKALRSPNETKKLWVEELCICTPVQNEHAAFRAFQERSTSLIYNRAQRTIVWVGPHTEHTEAALFSIEMLSQHCNPEDGNLPSPSDLERNPDLKELGLVPFGSEKWESLLSFFPPHLFTQGWLLHDVAFGNDKFVKIGDYELEWETFDRVRDMLAQPSWMSFDWRRERHDDSGYFEGELGP